MTTTNATLRDELADLVDAHKRGAADARPRLRELRDEARAAGDWRGRQQIENALRHCGE